MLQYGDMSKDKYVMRRYRIARKMLLDETFIFPATKILDIGCYDGYFLSTLPSMDGYGVDTDDEAFLVAENRGIKRYCDGKVDIVVCMETLEHQQNPEEMVNWIKKTLKPNGKLLVSLPNECTIWHRFKMIMGWGINEICFAPWYHLHFPTLRQNDSFISKHFKILRKRYWVYGLPEWFAFWPGLFARGVIYVVEQRN